MSAAVDFARVFAAIPASVLLLAPDAPRFTIVGVTDSYLADTMTKREEILGRGLFEVFPDNPDDPSDGPRNVRASLMRVIERRQPDTMAVQKYDIPIPGDGFEARYWSPRNTPVLDDNGAIKYICHRVEDVTDIVHLKQRGEEQRMLAESLSSQAGEMQLEIYRRAQEIQAANRELEAARRVLQAELSSQTHDVANLGRELVEQGRRLAEALELTKGAVVARDEFLSIASHELRTPLTPLLLMIDNLEIMLGRDGQLTPKISSNLLIARRQIERLADLVEEMLEVSRITVGRLKLHVEELDLVEIVRESIAKLGHEAESAGCEIILRAPQSINGCWDRARMRQVATNLISNAIKYGRRQPVIVEVTATDSHVTIATTDHGIGIEPDKRDKIFDRFERAVSVRNYGGFGLGLFVTRNVVEAHGGTVVVDSEPGKGSRFTVDLPRHAVTS